MTHRNPIPYDIDKQLTLYKEKLEDCRDLFVPIFEGQKLSMEWVLEGWIPLGYLVLLASGPKSGKTCLATQIALAVSTGTPFAGIPTRQSGVLWLAQEESSVERRLMLEASPLALPTTPIYTCYDHLPIDDDATFFALDYWLRETGSKFIVIDPLHGATSGRSLADGWSARKTLKKLKSYCARNRVTALVIHHSKGPTRSRPQRMVAENDQLAATASMQIVMSSQISHSPLVAEQARLITLECQGRGEFANMTLNLLSTSPVDFRLADQRQLRKPQPKAQFGWVEETILNHLQEGPHTCHQLAAKSTANPGSIRNALTRLRTAGLVRKAHSNSLEFLYECVPKTADEVNEVLLMTSDSEVGPSQLSQKTENSRVQKVQ